MYTLVHIAFQADCLYFSEIFMDELKNMWDYC